MSWPKGEPAAEKALRDTETKGGVNLDSIFPDGEPKKGRGPSAPLQERRGFQGAIPRDQVPELFFEAFLLAVVVALFFFADLTDFLVPFFRVAFSCFRLSVS